MNSVRPRTFLGSGYLMQRNLVASILVDFFRSHLKQVVTIHQAMFQKLLFEDDSAVDLELAELFQDVGKTYLRISERISENASQHSLQD